MRETLWGNITALQLLRSGVYKEHPIKPVLIAYSNSSYCTKRPCVERKRKRSEKEETGLLQAPCVVPEQLACKVELREYIKAHKPSDGFPEAGGVCKDIVEVG